MGVSFCHVDFRNQPWVGVGSKHPYPLSHRTDSISFHVTLNASIYTAQERNNNYQVTSPIEIS